jgi:hypothetical protein
MFIVKTNLILKGHDAFTVYPFIFVRPEVAADEGVIAHETLHAEEQKKSFVLPWLVRFAFSKQFRQEAEIRGYKKQIALGKITVGKAANRMTKYGLGINFIEACKLLRLKT